MNLNVLLRKYIEEGYSNASATAKACQDIIILKIKEADLNNHVTIKGGVVMMNLSKDKRRATQDIDIDFIKYSLDDAAINEFINKLSDKNIKIKVVPPIKNLHHEDYDGKRVYIEISDNYNNKYKTKLDIGVHKNLDILQDELCFDLENLDSSVTLLANSKEQICIEKLKSLLKFGVTSTRYKDIFDIYYLINQETFNSKKFISYINRFIFDDNKMKEKDLDDIIARIKSVLTNNLFKSMLNSTKNNWLGIPIDEVEQSIINYLSKLKEGN